MIDRATFTAGMSVIALQLNLPAVKQTLDAYHLALADETDPAEWRRFFTGAVKRFGWRFLPTVPQLLDALREFRGAPPLEAEAIEAYERVLQAGAYTPEGGTSWTFRGVRESCGRAAAEAFLEAGGNGAFANTFRESERRERFVASYVQAARGEPEARLLPAGEPEPRAILAAPTEAEAVRIVDHIRDLAGEQPARPKPKDGVVVATDERLAELRRQAEEIKADRQKALA